MSPSPPARGAWIEIFSGDAPIFKISVSPPARGAWIEIESFQPLHERRAVAPREGGVD